MFCNIGHDPSDAAVIFLILTGRSYCLIKHVLAESFPEMLQSDNHVKFVHWFTFAVQSDDFTDIFHCVFMPFAGKIQRYSRQGKTAKDRFCIFLE